MEREIKNNKFVRDDMPTQLDKMEQTYRDYQYVGVISS